MPHADFVHLRTHSAFSLSEGAIKVPQLVDLAAKHQMPAIAITDKGNLFGAMEFSDSAIKSGIQPIIGIELAVSEKKTEIQLTSGTVNTEPGIIVLLVQNEEGWKNIMELSSRSHLDTPAGESPQVTYDDLQKFSSGLIALSGGIYGPIGKPLLEENKKNAYKVAEKLKVIFQDRFYLEIMRHDIEQQIITESTFLDIATKFNIPIVATNDVYFSDPGMYEAHDALMCISQGVHIDQPERRRLTKNHYFRSSDEMHSLFSDLPEALTNTITLAKKTAYGIPSREPILPTFIKEGNQNEKDELRYQAEKGLEKRLSQHVYNEDMSDVERNTASKPYIERLNSELKIIIDMNFPGYFLIVADFIRWAKNKGIPVGPGRGSGAGSVVAWALTITDLDPLRFGLLFERFLNPERVSMPDFDIDFCRNRRDEVIDYVCDRYGSEKVAQIITFGKLEARAVIRDVGRVLGLPYGQVDKISKLIPFNPANPVKLSEAIDSEPMLQNMRDEDSSVAKLLQIALQLEGLYRHASTHAAGLVIGDRPLSELVPLYRDPRSTMPVTQFSMKYSENSGLVKFDFLGLKTLTVIEQACQYILESGHEVILEDIKLDDVKTFELLSSGHTVGVFQLESAGMRDVLRGLKPDTFEDIIALVALYRPGPMDNIPQYVARKHGKEKPDYLHDKLIETLRETFGVIIYQEQVMEIARVLAGYSLGAADLLRRAMGKKIQSEMDAQREIFVGGAIKNGVEKNQAIQIFDLVARFAGYGFNKSHAAAYALLAYQTAYLKANYPVEFMAATMTLDLNNTDKISAFKQELDRLNITLLPPDINKSGAHFTVEVLPNGSQAIRYALGAIKNVGEQAMQDLVSQRNSFGEFENLFSFAAQLELQSLNKRQVENLSKAGAFDQLCAKRKQVFHSADMLLRYADSIRRNANQGSLFDNVDNGAIPDLSLPDSDEWATSEKLQFEQESIGFFLSAHPLDDYNEILKELRVTLYTQLPKTARKDASIRLAGVVLSVQERSTAENKFAFVRLSDPTGSFEVAFFRDVYTKGRELLVSGNTLLVTANMRRDDEQIKLTAEKVAKLDAVIENKKTSLNIRINNSECIKSLHQILNREGQGKGTVKIIIELENKNVEIQLSETYSIPPTIKNEISMLTGVSGVSVK